MNIVVTRLLGSNKTNYAVSESCYTGQKQSYNDKKSYNDHICMFLRCITAEIIDYLYYSFIKILVIKITYKNTNLEGNSYSLLLNKTNVCMKSNGCVVTTLGRTHVSVYVARHRPNIKPTFLQCVMFAWTLILYRIFPLSRCE